MKLVFIHGAGGVKDSWQYQVDHFPESEAVNLPGHTEGEPCPSIEDYMKWLRGYILQQAYEDVVLVGHSMGGAIVQLYALEHPQELKAIILIGTGARLRVHPMFLSALEEATSGQSTFWEERFTYEFRFVEPEFAQALMAKQMSIDPMIRKFPSTTCVVVTALTSWIEYTRFACPPLSCVVAMTR